MLIMSTTDGAEAISMASLVLWSSRTVCGLRFTTTPKTFPYDALRFPFLKRPSAVSTRNHQ
jgi:hypothetical protein